jgi:tRNA(Ile)-lysidine synthase
MIAPALNNNSMNLLEKQFLDFLSHYCPDRPPMLLGLSGGPDSMALFHLLLQAGYPFEAAHVDHNWREESRAEAAFLKNLCDDHQIPFHLHILCKQLEKNNLEEKGRKARLSYFQSVIQKQGLHALFLAHHADDQAETVLKRLFEGATFPKLRGLLPVKQLGTLSIFRPLLKIGKKDILKWLEEKDIFYFEDPTNHDPSFLRSRLRNEMLPSLSQSFGKEVSNNLCRLGEAAAELSEFLEELANPYLSQVKELEEQALLDLSLCFPPHRYLLKTVLRQFFDRQGISISQSNVETIASHLQNKSSNKAIQIEKYQVIIHKRSLRLEKNEKKSGQNNDIIDRERGNRVS